MSVRWRAAFALSAAQKTGRGTTRGRFMTIATWTPERVEQLRAFVVTGLSCSQIAAEIGVSRNAVIGKIHRLGIGPGRPAAARARACPPRARRPRLPPQRKLMQLMFAATPCEASEDAALLAVESARRCSLLELAHGECRWPVGDPPGGARAADFVFCGNAAIAGFSYCVGHARLAYRASARRRG